MILEMEKAGIATEKHHHEVATAGQAEIDILLRSACCGRQTKLSDVQVTSSKNVARRHGKTVTFMHARCRFSATTGRACTTHQSIWKATASPLCREGICRRVADVSEPHRRYS